MMSLKQNDYFYSASRRASAILNTGHGSTIIELRCSSVASFKVHLQPSYLILSFIDDKLIIGFEELSSFSSQTVDQRL